MSSTEGATSPRAHMHTRVLGVLTACAHCDACVLIALRIKPKNCFHLKVELPPRARGNASMLSAMRDSACVCVCVIRRC